MLTPHRLKYGKVPACVAVAQPIRQKAHACLICMHTARTRGLTQGVCEGWKLWAKRRAHSDAKALPQRLVLVAALGRSSNDASGPAALPGSISQLRAGLAYEASKGFCNSTGRQLFSEFAEQRFRELQQEAHLLEQRAVFQRLCGGFQNYLSLDTEQRSRLVSEALAAVSVNHASSSPASLSPSTSHRADPGLSPQLQPDLERIDRSRAASTSYAAPSQDHSGSDRANALTQSLGTADIEGQEVSKLEISTPASKAPLLDSRDHYTFSDHGAEMPAAETAMQTVADRGGMVGEAVTARERDNGLPRVGQQKEFAMGSQLQVVEVEQVAIENPAGAEKKIVNSLYIDQPSIEEVTSLAGDAESIPVDEDIGEVLSEADQLRQSFQRAAALAAGSVSRETREAEMKSGAQRTAAWHELRDNRLTASAFGNALGFWEDGRLALWEEKLGLREKFRGNEATEWGTVREDDALERYVELTGHAVESRSFQMLRDDDVHGWLGASPDGLINGLVATPGLRPAGHKQILEGPGAGVLEIKCPYNRGDPLSAKPYPNAPWYYMAQVQGLMEIFDREWCNAFSYTVNGAAVYHIKRDRRYWADVFEVLADFWWAHLVPARHALEVGLPGDARLFEPPGVHPLTEELKERSKQMAKAASSIVYPPPALRSAALQPAGKAARNRTRAASSNW